MAGEHGHRNDEHQADDKRHQAHHELGGPRRLDQDQERCQPEDQDRDPERAAKEPGVRLADPEELGRRPALALRHMAGDVAGAEPGGGG